MTWRPMDREQAWLLPPSLDDLLPDDHPVRFVASFVDGLTKEEWAGFGVNMEGEALGAPAYHPRSLLSIWLYGFMTGVRSSRKLEASCRDQIPFLWLTGWQRPDHNTLWRFYKAHRVKLRGLLRLTVRAAVRLDLIDWAVQAVDGTKVQANASPSRTYDGQELERLLERTAQAIADLEAQNERGDDLAPPRLPPELRKAEQRRKRVLAARREMEEEGPRHANLTDPEARLMRSRGAYVTGYNAQAMAVPVSHGDGAGGGLLVTAAEVTQDQADNAQLLPLIAAAAESAERTPALTLADAGYFSGANLAACALHDTPVAMPEPRSHTAHPYHYRHFTYDAAADRYQCPEGRYLTFRRSKTKTGHAPVRLYQASGATCRACPAFGLCTTIKKGRRIEVSLHDAALQSHRRWMETPEARAAYRLRKQLVEPVFGIVKEQQGARRFLVRGIEAVRSEWSLLAVAFNLRTLQKAWRRSFFGLTRRGRALSRALSLWPSPSDTLLACPTHTPVLHRPAHIETFALL